MNKEDFFTKLKTRCPTDDEIHRTKGTIKIFRIKNGEEITKLYLGSDVFFFGGVFEESIKLSIEEHGISLLYCVSLPDYTWQ